MKNYIKFITEQITEKQNKYLSTVINYINHNSNIELFEYYDTFKIKKEDTSKELEGKLYFISGIDKAVRFNFSESYLYSVDVWDKFKLGIEKNENITNKPSYTFETNGSVIGILPDILSFIKGDYSLNEDTTIEQDEPKIKQASDERSELSSVDKDVLELDIDIFESIKLYTAQVAFSVSNSLIISGLPGLGKTFDSTSTLNNLRTDYIHVKGDTSTSGLYEILYKNRHKLILFDDMDNVFESRDSVNLLKAVLDTSPVRTVSRLVKTYFDSFEMTEAEIEEEYIRTGKLPKQFEFTGRIIFITNVDGDKLDEALISRSLFADVCPEFDEVLARVIKIMPDIEPNIKTQIKRDIIEFMVLLITDSKHEARFPLNIRTFIHCLNIYKGNNFPMKFGDKSVPAWKMLIKQFLVK